MPVRPCPTCPGLVPPASRRPGVRARSARRDPYELLSERASQNGGSFVAARPPSLSALAHHRSSDCFGPVRGRMRGAVLVRTSACGGCCGRATVCSRPIFGVTFGAISVGALTCRKTVTDSGKWSHRWLGAAGSSPWALLWLRGWSGRPQRPSRCRDTTVLVLLCGRIGCLVVRNRENRPDFRLVSVNILS